MVYCKYCGKENEDGSVYCEQCGKKISSIPNVITEDGYGIGSEHFRDSDFVSDNQNNGYYSTDDRQPEITVDKEKFRKTVKIAGVILGIIVILCAILAALASRVPLKGFIRNDISFYGANGYGSAEIGDIIDYSSLNIAMKEHGVSLKSIRYADANIADYISVEYDESQNGKLSNGDKISVVINVDKKGIERNKGFTRKISSKKKLKLKYTVSGLAEGTAINLFGAIDSYIFDTTNGRSSINLKTDYTESFDNNIKIGVDYNNVRVYGDDFYSFTVGFRTVTDNIDENSETVKIVTDCDFDRYLEYGIIIAPTEALIEPTIVSFVKNNSFSANALSVLTTRAKEYAYSELESNEYSYYQTILFYNNGNNDNEGNTLSFLFKGTDNYCVVYYSDIKQDQDGNIIEIEDLEPRADGWWGFATYKTISEYKDGITYSDEYILS